MFFQQKLAASSLVTPQKSTANLDLLKVVGQKNKDIPQNGDLPW